MKVEKPNVKKSPSHILSIFFHNKGLEFIQLKSILRKPSVISKLPEKLQEDSPSIVYSLTPTIRNKIFNYKDTAESINTDDIETLSLFQRILHYFLNFVTFAWLFALFVTFFHDCHLSKLFYM